MKVDMEELRHECGGKWIHQSTDIGGVTYKCSKCKIVRVFHVLNTWDDFE